MHPLGIWLYEMHRCNSSGDAIVKMNKVDYNSAVTILMIGSNHNIIDITSGIMHIPIF